MTFMRPEALVLLVVLPAFVWLHIKARSSGPLSRSPLHVLGLRLLLLVLLVGALARPVVFGEAAPRVRVVVADVSDSMGDLDGIQAEVDRIVREAQPSETVRLLAFAGEAREILSMPRDPGGFPPLSRSGFRTDASHLEEALDLARILIPDVMGGAVSLVSDGRESRGSARDAAARLAARGIPLDVVERGVVAAGPVCLEPRLPCQAPVGIPVEVEVRVESGTDGVVRARLRGVDPETPDRIVSLPVQNGEGSTVILHEVKTPGLNRLEIALLDPTGAEIAGTTRPLAVHGTPPRQVWLLESREVPSMLEPVKRLLGPGARVVRKEAEALTGQEDLMGVDSVVLADVPAHAVRPEALTALAAAVEGGLGCLVTGGERSFGPGGYAGTLLEDLLPVRFQQKEERRDPSATLVVIIDTSGSMGGTRIQLAKEVARLALRRLKPHDKAGIVEFHGAKRWAAPIQPASSAVDIQRALNRLNAGGGTIILPAIEEAFYGLLNVRTRTRHVLVLTDGGVEQGPFEPLIRKMADQGMTLSTVLVGPGTHSAFLVSLAQWGRGRYYHAPDRFNMPEVIVKQPESSLLSPVLEEPTDIRVVGDSFIPRQVPEIAGLKLQGLLEVEARPTADVLLESGRGEPLLCTWRYGLGRVSAWMSEVSGPWSRDLSGRESYARLITGLFRAGSRSQSPGRVTVRALPARDRLTVFAWREPGGEAPPFLRVRVESEAETAGRPGRERFLAGGEGSGLEAPYGLVFREIPAGMARITVTDDGGTTLGRGAVGLQAENEWSRARPDRSHLQNLARITGGRPDGRLTPASARAAEQGFEVWRDLLWGALAVFLALVGVRRLARGWLRRTVPAAGILLAVLVAATCPAQPQDTPAAALPGRVPGLLDAAASGPYTEVGEKALTEAVQAVRRRDGNLEALLSHLEQKARVDASSSRLLARVASMDGSLERARTLLETLDRAGHLDGGGLAEYGRILENLGREDAALAVLDRALKAAKNPALVVALRVRKAGLLLSRPGEESALGLQPLRAILAAHPDSADLASYVAFLAALHGKSDLFEEIPPPGGSRKSLFRDHLTRGTVYLQSGHHGRAQQHFLAAMDAAPLVRDRRYAQERLISAHRASRTLVALCSAWLQDSQRTPERVDALIAVLRELKRPEEALKLLLVGEGMGEEAQKKKRPFRSLQREIIGLALECNRPEEVEDTYLALVKREPKRVEWRSGLALLYLLRGDRSAAARQFAAGLEAAGANGKLCMRLARSARDLSLEGEARRAAQKATTLDEDSRLRGCLFLANRAFKAGDMDGALKGLGTLEKTFADSDEALAQVADAYERFRQPGEAIRVLTRIEKRSTMEDVLMRLAWLLQGERRKEEALELWKRLWKATRLPARVRQAEDRLLDLCSNTGGLADLAIELEETLEAGKGGARDLGLLVKLYSRAHDPVSAVEVLKAYGRNMGKGKVETLQAMAHVYQHCEDYRRYEETLLELQRLDPDNALDYQQQIAVGALERGRGRQARRALDRLRALAPGDVQTEEFTAGVLAMVGLLEESIKAYVRVVAGHPDRIEDYLLMANVLRDAGRRDQALRMFLDLLEGADKDDLFTVAVDGLLNLNADRPMLRIAQRRVKERIARRPHKAFLYQLAADLAEEMRDTEEQVAMTSLMVIVSGERRSAILRELMDLEAARGNPEGLIDFGRSLLALGEEMPPQVFLDLGRALIRTGDLATAERVFARTRIAGDFVSMQQRIAGYYVDAGYVVDAARILRQALLARPTDVELLIRVGTLAEVAGNRTQARRDFDLAMDILLRRSPPAVGKPKKKAGSAAATARATSSITMGGVTRVFVSHYSRNRNVDDYQRFSSQVMGGLLANHPQPGTELLEGMEQRIRQEVKSLEAAGRFRDALKDNPRLDRLLAFTRKAALVYDAFDLANRVDALVLEKYPKDTGKRKGAVQDRINAGLLNRARTLATTLGFNVEHDFSTLHLDSLLKKKGAVQKILDQVNVPAALASTWVQRLITAGRHREATALLEEVDPAEPSVSAGSARAMMRAAVLLGKKALIRRWVGRWMEAEVLKGHPRSIHRQLETLYVSAWGHLSYTEREALWNHLTRLADRARDKRKPAVMGFLHNMGMRLGKPVQADVEDFLALLEASSKSFHGMTPVLKMAPPAYLSSLLKRALKRLPDRNRRGQLLGFATSFPVRLDRDMVDAVAAAYRDAREDKRSQVISYSYYASRLVHVRTNPDLAYRLVRLLRKDHSDHLAFGLAEGILAHRTGRQEKGRKVIEETLGKILKRDKFERNEESLVNQILASGEAGLVDTVTRTLKGLGEKRSPIRDLIEARCLRNQGRPVEAATLLARAYAAKPDHSGIRSAYLAVLRSLGRDAEVAEIWRPWLEKQTADNTYPFRILANTYRILDRPGLALEAVRKVKPGTVDAMEIYLLRKLGRGEAEIRKAFRRYAVQYRSRRFYFSSAWPVPPGKGGLQQTGTPGAASAIPISFLRGDPTRSMYWSLAEEPWAREELESAWRYASSGNVYMVDVMTKSVARARYLGQGREGVVADLVRSIGKGDLTAQDLALLMQVTENGARPLPEPLLPALELLRSQAVVKGNRDLSVVRFLADLYRSHGHVEGARSLYLHLLMESLSRHWYDPSRAAGKDLVDIYVRTFPEAEQKARRLKLLERFEGVLLGDPATSFEMVWMLIKQFDKVGEGAAPEEIFAYAEKVLAAMPDHMSRRPAAKKLQCRLALSHARRGNLDRFNAAVRRILVQGSSLSGSAGFLDVRSFLPEPVAAREAVVLARALGKGFETLLTGHNLARARIQLAGWLAQAGEKKEARALVQTALPVQADLGADDRLVLADVARLIGDLDVAYGIEKALLEEKALNIPRAVDLLEEMVRREGEAAADAAALRLAEYTDNPPILIRAARAASKAGDKDGARKILERLEAVRPGRAR